MKRLLEYARVTGDRRKHVVGIRLSLPGALGAAVIRLVGDRLAKSRDEPKTLAKDSRGRSMARRTDKSERVLSKRRVQLPQSSAQ